MLPFSFSPMDRISAEAVLSWRYSPPYDIYNPDPAQHDEDLAYLLDPANRFYAITDAHGRLVAFCSFGADAQVSGWEYGGDSLDVGLGVRPDLTGQGHGHMIVTAAVDFARQSFGPPALRATIAAFNLRAQRAWGRAGFRPVAHFTRPDGRAFVVMVLGPDAPTG